MGSTSEREYRERLLKIRQRLNKRAEDVRKDFAKIQKMKVESLKKTEDIRNSADKDVEKLERNVIKSKDLAPESKQRLHSEISVLKSEIDQKNSELKTRISQTMIPSMAYA